MAGVTSDKRPANFELGLFENNKIVRPDLSRPTGYLILGTEFRAPFLGVLSGFEQLHEMPGDIPVYTVTLVPPKIVHIGTDQSVFGFTHFGGYGAILAISQLT